MSDWFKTKGSSWAGSGEKGLFPLGSSGGDWKGWFGQKAAPKKTQTITKTIYVMGDKRK